MTQLLIKKMIFFAGSSFVIIHLHLSDLIEHITFLCKSFYVVNGEFLLSPLSLNGCSRYSQVSRGDEWVVKECLSDCIIRPVLLAAPSA